jgi:RNase P protein component
VLLQRFRSDFVVVARSDSARSDFARFRIDLEVIVQQFEATAQ